MLETNINKIVSVDKSYEIFDWAVEKSGIIKLTLKPKKEGKRIGFDRIKEAAEATAPSVPN